MRVNSVKNDCSRPAFGAKLLNGKRSLEELGVFYPEKLRKALASVGEETNTVRILRRIKMIRPVENDRTWKNTDGAVEKIGLYELKINNDHRVMTPQIEESIAAAVRHVLNYWT